jgi:predicted transcriptional regulator
METTKELTDKIYHFDRVYKKVTKDIVSDWKTLSTYSSEYYDKFHEDDLTDEDKESFDQVTVNMFVRFQIFNEQVENVNNLYKAIDRINHSIFTINETVLKLEEKNEKIRNRIIEIDEMEEYV